MAGGPDRGAIRTTFAADRDRHRDVCRHGAMGFRGTPLDLELHRSRSAIAQLRKVCRQRGHRRPRRGNKTFVGSAFPRVIAAGAPVANWALQSQVSRREEPRQRAHGVLHGVAPGQ